jgi:hypothetical protein
VSAAYLGNVFRGLFPDTGNESLSPSAVTLASLGERGLILDLDIYGKRWTNDRRLVLSQRCMTGGMDAAIRPAFSFV